MLTEWCLQEGKRRWEHAERTDWSTGVEWAREMDRVIAIFAAQLPARRAS